MPQANRLLASRFYGQKFINSTGGAHAFRRIPHRIVHQ